MFGCAPEPVHVDREELAEQRVHVLCAVLGVAARAAVAHAHVEQAVRAEDQVPAVVVRVRVVEGEDRTRGAGEGARPVRAVLDHPRVPAAVRVVHVEAVVLGVVRMERQAEQPLLAAREDEPTNVEEEARADTAAVDHADRAALLDDVHPARLPGRRGQRDRLCEAAHDRHEPGPRGACGLGRTNGLVAATVRAAAGEPEGHPERRNREETAHGAQGTEGVALRAADANRRHRRRSGRLDDRRGAARRARAGGRRPRQGAAQRALVPLRHRRRERGTAPADGHSRRSVSRPPTC